MVITKRCFTGDECDKIRKLSYDLEFKHSTTLLEGDEAKLFDPFGLQPMFASNQYRVMENAWLKCGPVGENKWIYDKIYDTAKHINDEVWKFNLQDKSGAYENDMQYSMYHKDGYYNAHRDDGYNRILSMTIQLTDEKEYKGGELDILTENNDTIVGDKRKGMGIFFPSQLLHRVNPVKEGVRENLVWWIKNND